MTLTLNFKFDKNNYDRTKSFHDNLYSGNFSNFVDSGFCRTSQLLEVLKSFKNTLEIKIQIHAIDNDIDNYIISASVFYSPYDWTDKNSNLSIFEYLNKTYVRDLQAGKAILLIDQTVEGYHSEWVWDWFHNKCKQYNISPKAIIYATGNQLAKEQYNLWCNKNKIDDKIQVIPSVSLAYYIYQTYKQHNLDINFNNLLSFKENNNIKLYNCTNLRPRPQRIINFLQLVQSNLINDGLISIGNSNDWQITDKQLLDYKLSKKTIKVGKNLTPMIINHKQHNDTEFSSFITRILDDVYEQTWVSLITESSYFEHEESVFISEKTFKAIAAMHPFIIVGSKHSLKYLRKLGYKTFDGFIDESYDDLDDEDRFTAVMESLNKIKNIPDKLNWYSSMQEILEHNQKLFLSMGSKTQEEHTSIINYYKEYFNL